ncbi:hypothetical protein, partial [Burkholderia thailandensis]|uniref:hypothetical protein n=1 Tax=Burkholderia thailandensis TaxID=57975 RepID=UPI001ED91215
MRPVQSGGRLLFLSVDARDERRAAVLGLARGVSARQATRSDQRFAGAAGLPGSGRRRRADGPSMRVGSPLPSHRELRDIDLDSRLASRAIDRLTSL